MGRAASSGGAAAAALSISPRRSSCQGAVHAPLLFLRRFVLFCAVFSAVLPGVDAQGDFWSKLVRNIERSSNLNTQPGSTLERDVQALIFFFNNTCTEAVENAGSNNPYRGAFSLKSQWLQQQGWESIVRAHSSVQVQCRSLYMEGGEELAAKHCFWNIQSLEEGTVNGTRYPNPRWTIIEDCCEKLQRPVLQIRDAVWATTRGVGRAYRAATAAIAQGSNQLLADDVAYVPKLDCTSPENIFDPFCDSTTHNIYTKGNTRCTASLVASGAPECQPAAKPIGVRSKHYFNVGLAVAQKGVIVRTVDGGYSWDCVRGCDRTVPLPELLSISVNVRLGGFGYSQTYYDANGASIVDGRDWSLLNLQGVGMYTGLDGVFWPETSQTKMEGFAVGRAGSIVRIEDARINGWDPDDRDNPQATDAVLTDVDPYNVLDGSSCRTSKAIHDVFFWNTHLAFFVGEQGFICRYGLEIQTATPARGPGMYIDDVLDGTVPLRWDLQGSDEQGLNWGKIVDNKDYMYSDLRSVFCLQVEDLNTEQWNAQTMDAAAGITYSQHITCFAVGTHPGTAGTTSAILRYSSSAAQIGADVDNPEFREEIAWRPQNSQTSTNLNDVYCVKTKDQLGNFLPNDPIYCYAVGDNGLVRFTSNGGVSPWRTRFSGVQENLRKVVIIQVTHSGGGNGDHAVAIGDNGRVIRTSDGGNTWEKLERVTPEHLVAIQFNAFDDYAYNAKGDDLSPESLYFETSGAQTMPFGNGIATGSVLYDWMSKGGECGLGSPNAGYGVNRNYNCKKPEVSVVLRTNCQSTSTSSWRCKPECQDRTATVPVALANTLADEATWNSYFGTRAELQAGVVVQVPRVQRGDGVSLRADVSQCDDVWTIGHGTQWHEDTRETRLYTTMVIDENALETQHFLDDVKAIRPAHELCMFGWPRQQYRMTEGRRRKIISNVSSLETPVKDYTFLGRLRYSEANCTAAGGRYYAAELNLLPDCVFEFGTLVRCPSWEIHGMGHTRDARNAPKATAIPFVNFSVISDPCADGWYGVTCEDHFDVDASLGAIPNKTITQIWLYSNNLQGSVPTLIQDLPSLRSLSLGSNRLVGTIPAHIWLNMSSLKYLSLAENSLTGKIPAELGALATLEELRLHANSLGGLVPTELGSLGSLQSLSLHGNSLHGAIPSELGDLSSLQYLWTSSNNFTGALPSELGKLSHLRYLWFANNSIDSIPVELGELGSLRSLDGSNNTIADRLPYSMGKLKNLRVLRLGRNRIRATLPDALGMCTALTRLELQHNQLVGPVPASFGALEELTVLDLSHNLLERKLSSSIDGMRSLQSLLLQDNNLEGGLPPSIGTLRALQKLNMANNKLTEPLPEQLSDCGQLEMVDLQNNRIRGPLPTSIWRLRMLEYLYLTNNRVQGPLPEGLGYLGQLRELRLDNNDIDGTLPATIGDAETIEVMRMDVNRLSGSLPSTVGKLRNVLHFDFHQNQLGGTIPPEVAGMESAINIYLQNNKLEGQIPSIGELPPNITSSLASLRELKLSRNELSGTIPPSLGRLYSLRHLALDNNEIGGSIPDELGLLSSSLKLLHLQGNRLNGLLPTFFRLQPFRAVAINLAGNPFWCPLPAWPALNGTASCVHCPSDLYLEDDHRTCSDHGVCIDGIKCRCDPRWEGETCNKLRCPNECNQHGNCFNERVPQACELVSAITGGGKGTGAAAGTTAASTAGATAAAGTTAAAAGTTAAASGNSSEVFDITAGMCTQLTDDCVQAYHDCPNKGISIQVDSTGIVIAVAPKHNQIVYARCECTDAWSGNDCTMPPLPPPTIQPWPDPYLGFEEVVDDPAASPGSRSRGAAAGAASAQTATPALTLAAVAAAILAGGRHRER